MLIKVLFIPNPMPSHIIPLIVLAKKLSPSGFETAFLLPKDFHEYVRKLDVTVLEIDRKMEDRTTPEMIAFTRFKPNVVVDDLSYTTAFSTRFANIPRISIVRRGVIPFETNTAGYKHSSSVIQFLESVNKLNLPSYGIWKPNTVADLFVGNINIIPSIPSIEELPKELKNDSSYMYSGPLLLSDKDITKNLTSISNSITGKKYEDNRADVEQFLERNKGRKIIYFTHGLTIPSEITSRSHAVIKFLLGLNAAIITNLHDYPSLNPDEQNRFFSASFLPMHMVCSRADLMIHHCGSGTYNYQVLSEVPAIILGSRCYDRDDVARHLDNINAATYISADLPEEVWQAKVEETVLLLLDPSSKQYGLQKKQLANLHLEADFVSKNFDFGDVILKTIHDPLPAT